MSNNWHFLPAVELNSRTPVTNVLSIKRALIDRDIEELTKGRSRTQWSMGQLTLNAYYSPPDSKFVMLQGILQHPFFDEGYSDIENLGAIGAVIGHELGHGIDDKGARYDTQGKLRQWMSKQDLEEFKARGVKFVERFNKIGHNGVLTLGENIGDHVGLTFGNKAAFPDPSKASQSKDNMANADMLSRANMEDERKFFEAYARLWCGVVRPEFEKTLLKTDPHSLGYARINEQVIHQDAFHTAYQCKQTDKMYLKPEDRLRVW